MSGGIVGFDVGNSTVKAGWFDMRGIEHVRFDMRGIEHVRFDTRSIEHVRFARHDTSEAIEAFVDAAISDRPFQRAIIATVHAEASARLCETLQRRSIEIAAIYQSDGRLFDEGRIGCGVETPKTTGVDRVLASMAAVEKSPGRDVIVVTCGSAITVNLTTSDRVFHGGAILPGLEMMARSLHEQTAALPRIQCPPREKVDPAEKIDRSIPTLPGRSTVTAMRAGCYYAAIGSIERIVDELRSSLGSEPETYLTGGDAKFLSSGLGKNIHYAPALVLEGLRLLLPDESKS